MAVLAFTVVLCKILEAEKCCQFSDMFSVCYSHRSLHGLTLSIPDVVLAYIFPSLAFITACMFLCFFFLLENFVLRFHRPGKTCRPRVTAQFTCIGFIFLICSNLIRISAVAT